MCLVKAGQGSRKGVEVSFTSTSSVEFLSPRHLRPRSPSPLKSSENETK